MFEVFIEENSRYAGESGRLSLGTFANFTDALNVCKKIVDDFLKANYKQETTAEELYQIYKTFGEDAFIVGSGGGFFSAWQYAEQRCREICGNASFDQETIK